MSSRKASPPAWSIIDAVANAAEPPSDYARWLTQAAPSSDDYLFSEAKVRFRARDTDRLVAPLDLEVTALGSDVVLSSKQLGGSVRIRDVSEQAARRSCTGLDGRQTVAEVRARTAVEESEFGVLLDAALGRVLFVPEAVAELELRVSGTELVRFVGTPYEVERAYWENMGDVRESTPLLLRDVGDATSFTKALRRLHVLSLLGSSLNNFYRPASRVADRKVLPGALYTTAVQSEETELGTLLLAGPRVGVPFVGGINYHALVCADDAEALEPTRSVRDASGVAWGRVVDGRAPDEAQNRAWFLPPRPLSEQHFESLYSAYVEAAQAARATDASRNLLARALARFHFRFVRLHPFRCANQSLSMNLVNQLLVQGLGVTMPHSLLDQFALRLSEAAYEAVFARAVAHTSGSGAPAQRWAELRRQKADAYSLIESLQNASSPSAARALCEASPGAAKAALIAD